MSTINCMEHVSQVYYFAEINLKSHSDVIKYLFTFIREGERCGLAVCLMSKPH